MPNSSSGRQSRLYLSIFLAAFFSAASAGAQEWPHYGGDLGGTKYSPLSQINRPERGEPESRLDLPHRRR